VLHSGRLLPLTTRLESMVGTNALAYYEIVAVESFITMGQMISAMASAIDQIERSGSQMTSGGDFIKLFCP
jgi:hypothetical protein